MVVLHSFVWPDDDHEMVDVIHLGRFCTLLAGVCYLHVTIKFLTRNTCNCMNSTVNFKVNSFSLMFIRSVMEHLDACSCLVGAKRWLQINATAVPQLRIHMFPNPTQSLSLKNHLHESMLDVYTLDGLEQWTGQCEK